MKTYTVTTMTLTFCILFSSGILAQLSDVGDLPEKYREVSIGFGLRTLSTVPGTIETQFVDNSPSMDKFSGSFQVADSYNRAGFNLGYNWGRYNGLSHKLMFDAALGDHVATIFGYGIGWNITRSIGNGILNINPGIYGAAGNYGFGIGQIENNALFIQIGETRYTEESLGMTLSSQAFLYGPELSIDYDISDHLRLWINAAYDIASTNSLAKLTFEGDNDSSELNLEGANPLVTYNGAPIKSLPYDASGLRLTSGVSYVWHRY